MDKLEKLKKEREELDKRIETLEYAERIFEEGDEIYYVEQFGNVNCGNWGNHEWIYGAFSQGHIFRTKQEAELEAKRRNLLTRFNAFRDECNNGWEPVSGKQCKTSKFLIGYNWDSKDEQYKLKSLELGSSNLFNQFGYFKNREDCEKAIELFGDEIKALFVDCEV